MHIYPDTGVCGSPVYTSQGPIFRKLTCPQILTNVFSWRNNMKKEKEKQGTYLKDKNLR
jgi:hypothetical protein